MKSTIDFFRRWSVSKAESSITVVVSVGNVDILADVSDC